VKFRPPLNKDIPQDRSERLWSASFSESIPNLLQIKKEKI
jgi:hypothetical protein